MINSFFTEGFSLASVSQFYSVHSIDTGSGTPDTPQNKPNTNYTPDELRKIFHPATVQTGKPEQTAASRKEDALKFLANAGMFEPAENPSPKLDSALLANASVIELPNPKESPKLDDKLLANVSRMEPITDTTPDLPNEITT